MRARDREGEMAEIFVNIRYGLRGSSRADIASDETFSRPWIKQFRDKT